MNVFIISVGDDFVKCIVTGLVEEDVYEMHLLHYVDSDFRVLERGKVYDPTTFKYFLDRLAQTKVAFVTVSFEHSVGGIKLPNNCFDLNQVSTIKKLIDCNNEMCALVSVQSQAFSRPLKIPIPRGMCKILRMETSLAFLRNECYSEEHLRELFPEMSTCTLYQDTFVDSPLAHAVFTHVNPRSDEHIIEVMGKINDLFSYEIYVDRYLDEKFKVPGTEIQASVLFKGFQDFSSSVAGGLEEDSGGDGRVGGISQKRFSTLLKGRSLKSSRKSGAVYYSKT